MFERQQQVNRRLFLERCGVGMGMLGLASLCHAETGSPESMTPTSPRSPHFAPKAKRVIHIFLNGGPSHIDTFDPKPRLKQYRDRTIPAGNLQSKQPIHNAMPSPYTFRNYGASGLPISEVFAELGEFADDLCVIRSMHADMPIHESSLMLMNCGDAVLPRPSMGAWLTYGLGSENQNLPGFIALCPEGYPVKGTDNWRSAFLPGIFQGTYINPLKRDVASLIANIRPATDASTQRRRLDLLQQLNRQHRRERSDARLDARIASFEQAFRMQTEAAEVFDLSREPKATREAYGSGVHARQCLLARRLIERGVRFVQLWHGEGQPWDSHENIKTEHAKLARQCSRPIAALLRDLKHRGLLEDTLVVCGGEFGRTPTAEGGTGRDHNHLGFTVWLAGGGVKGGYIHGGTDELGWSAVDKPVHVHDLHATILHLLGLDHQQLTYRHAGRDFRLTDVHGKVVDAMIA